MKYLLPISLAAIGAALAAPAAAQTTSATGNWTGPYVGVNVGYGGGDFTDHYSGSTDPAGTNPVTGRLRQTSAGVLGGGQIGYNYETAGGVVFGAEADIAASDIGSKTSFSSVDSLGNVTDASLSPKIDYLGTVRARVGKAMFDDRFVPYVTGGFAYGGVKSRGGYDCTACAGGSFDTGSVTHTGWTAGAGAEYALTHHLSMKAEYLYADLGRDGIGADGSAYSVPGATIYNASASEKATANIMRVGLNYRF